MRLTGADEAVGHDEFLEGAGRVSQQSGDDAGADKLQRRSRQVEFTNLDSTSQNRLEHLPEVLARQPQDGGRPEVELVDVAGVVGEDAVQPHGRGVDR